MVAGTEERVDVACMHVAFTVPVDDAEDDGDSASLSVKYTVVFVLDGSCGKHVRCWHVKQPSSELAAIQEAL